MSNEKVFSFDLGTGSIAYCTRQNSSILESGVDMLPAEYASLKDVREKRRLIKTKLAHKAREHWWVKQAEAAGLEVLETKYYIKNDKLIPPDPRVTIEFSKPGDSTIYNSYLLRIALLRGKDLEPWQIFKAIWSAIQRRGYEPVPWKVQDENGDKKKLNEIMQAVENYKKELKDAFGDREEYYYPCYLEAYRLGIWSPDDPDNLSKTIGNNPQPIRNKDGKINRIIPREYLEKEIKELLKQAGKKYPYLEQNLNIILYGPSGTKYPAYLLKQYRRYQGRDWEWQGLLSQKTPRFDNRVISKCRLIPRLNVCRRKDELNQEVVFLMNLKNFRYIDAETGEFKALSPEELNKMFEAFKDVKKITKTKLKEYLQKNLNGIVHPSHTEIPAPNTSGRSSFCRPALRILKYILLSGKSPHEVYNELVSKNTNTDPNKGLVNDDYKFLLSFPEDWNNFHIPDFRDVEPKYSEEERLEKIHKIFSEIKNPVVKHRLVMFYNRLKYLEQKYGQPDIIVFEFLRDPENTLEPSRKRKEKYKKIMKQNLERKEQAREELSRLRAQGVSISGRNAVEKIKLWKEQNGIDIYTGEPIGQTEISMCEIDHIVPRSLGGSDAEYNKVLVKLKTNQEKGQRTPYEWLGSDKQKWMEFTERVSKIEALSDKKKSLLLSEDPKSLIELYTHLAESSYLARLAKKLVHLHFRWFDSVKGSNRRVYVVSGAFTSKIRSLFKLNSLTYSEQENNVSSNNQVKKNVDNPKNHVLDAIVISVTPEIKFNPQKNKDEYPEWFTYEFCKQALDNCRIQSIRFTKPKISETIYGLRRYIDDNGKPTNKYVFVSRFGGESDFSNYFDLNYAKKHVDSIYSYVIRRDLKKILKQNPTPEEWKEFLENYSCGSKPKKVRKIFRICSLDEVDRYFKKLSKSIDTFIETKIPGQFIANKDSYKGYFVYKSNGKWTREAVCSFESEYLKRKEIYSKYPNQKIYFLRPGMYIKVKSDIDYTSKRGRKVRRFIRKGIYRLEGIGVLSDTKKNSKNKTYSIWLSTLEGEITGCPLNEFFESTDIEVCN